MTLSLCWSGWCEVKCKYWSVWVFFLLFLPRIYDQFRANCYYHQRHQRQASSRGQNSGYWSFNLRKWWATSWNCHCRYVTKKLDLIPRTSQRNLNEQSWWFFFRVLSTVMIRLFLYVFCFLFYFIFFVCFFPWRCLCASASCSFFNDLCLYLFCVVCLFFFSFSSFVCLLMFYLRNKK